MWRCLQAARIHPAIQDLPTEHGAVREHGCSPQPEPLKEGRHGRQAATGSGTDTEGLPPPPFLPHSKSSPHLCSSKKLSPEKVIPGVRLSLCSSPALYPHCSLPYNGLLHKVFPFKESLLSPLSAPEPKG